MWLSFTAHSPSDIYVAGLDHEVYCGTWSNSSLNQRNLERAAFRGDARWVGLSRTSDPIERRGGDHIVGVTDSAQMYVLRNAHLQAGPMRHVDHASHSSSSAAPIPMDAAHAAARARRDAVTAARKERVAAGLSALTAEEEQRRKGQQKQKQQRKRKTPSTSQGETLVDANTS